MGWPSLGAAASSRAFNWTVWMELSLPSQCSSGVPTCTGTRRTLLRSRAWAGEWLWHWTLLSAAGSAQGAGDRSWHGVVPYPLMRGLCDSLWAQSLAARSACLAPSCSWKAGVCWVTGDDLRVPCCQLDRYSCSSGRCCIIK